MIRTNDKYSLEWFVMQALLLGMVLGFLPDLIWLVYRVVVCLMGCISDDPKNSL